MEKTFRWRVFCVDAEKQNCKCELSKRGEGLRRVCTVYLDAVSSRVMWNDSVLPTVDSIQLTRTRKARKRVADDGIWIVLRATQEQLRVRTGRELETRVPALSQHYGANKSKLYDRKEEEKKKSNKYYLLPLPRAHTHTNRSTPDDDDKNKIIPQESIKRLLMISGEVSNGRDKLQSEQKIQRKKNPFESSSNWWRLLLSLPVPRW